MPRIARVSIPGIPVHVTQRGNYIKLGDSHQLKKEFKPLFLLSLGGV